MDFDPGEPGLRMFAFVAYHPRLLAADRCAALIADAERRGFALAPINMPGGAQVRTDIRDNERVIFDDAALAATLWSVIGPVTPARVGDGTAVGLNERFRAYRYSPGQRFMMHRDGPFVRESGERSRLTVLIYLNDDYDGGRTEFEEGGGVPPTTGGVLLFAHPLRHAGARVTRGRKYVLRTDVMYDR